MLERPVKFSLSWDDYHGRRARYGYRPEDTHLISIQPLTAILSEVNSSNSEFNREFVAGNARRETTLVSTLNVTEEQIDRAVEILVDNNEYPEDQARSMISRRRRLATERAERAARLEAEYADMPRINF